MSNDADVLARRLAAIPAGQLTVLEAQKRILKEFTSSTFNLRMPPDLKEKLAECAIENDRSLNAEIVQRLRRSINGYSR